MLILLFILIVGGMIFAFRKKHYNIGMFLAIPLVFDVCFIGSMLGYLVVFDDLVSNANYLDNQIEQLEEKINKIDSELSVKEKAIDGEMYAPSELLKKKVKTEEKLNRAKATLGEISIPKKETKEKYEFWLYFNLF